MRHLPEYACRPCLTKRAQNRHGGRPSESSVLAHEAGPVGAIVAQYCALSVRALHVRESRYPKLRETGLPRAE